MWGTQLLTMEQVYFCKGEMHLLRLLERLPEEIKRSQELLKEAHDEENI